MLVVKFKQKYCWNCCFSSKTFTSVFHGSFYAQTMKYEHRKQKQLYWQWPYSSVSIYSVSLYSLRLAILIRNISVYLLTFIPVVLVLLKIFQNWSHVLFSSRLSYSINRSCNMYIHACLCCEMESYFLASSMNSIRYINFFQGYCDLSVQIFNIVPCTTILVGREGIYLCCLMMIVCSWNL